MGICFLGIDPGVNGGWALLDHGGGIVGCGISDIDFLVTVKNHRVARAALEKVTGFRGEGEAKGQRIHKLMEDYGRWQGRLEALGIETFLVPSNSWQGYHRVRIASGMAAIVGRAKVRQSKRDMILNLARLLFPSAPLSRKKDDGVATALLLADFARCGGTGRGLSFRRGRAR
jgi:hypothetical protein